ncbi:hypothetical protein Bpfe_030191 [Biomphalaria pfeifferi]|uniref:Uncharacterized protein n=1 Tax=Biomphalaria pfeifferi TaxID=112525 RepID=A0AAD8EU32_BIOPF|nr:hypothetical protein Bpfe_030191 [Biomphalaria pfeifferi]
MFSLNVNKDLLSVSVVSVKTGRTKKTSCSWLEDFNKKEDRITLRRWVNWADDKWCAPVRGSELRGRERQEKNEARKALQRCKSVSSAVLLLEQQNRRLPRKSV